MKSALVLGAGSWGTALAHLLSTRFEQLTFWGRDAELMAEIAVQRCNVKYLPKLRLADSIDVCSDLTQLGPVDVIVWVTPSNALPALAEQLKRSKVVASHTVMVSCSKGIEAGTFRCMTEILHEHFPLQTVAALSGPNHAEEIALGLPAAAVIACADEPTGRALQQRFSYQNFRCYTSQDILGVEWAGAMKNPYAIAAGIAEGLALGDNAKATLITRALAEMVRLGVARGGRLESFYGLSGIGDLVATCFSAHSRNHRVGLQLGQGKSLEQILASSPMVAEGVVNTRNLFVLAQHMQIDMPLLEALHEVLYQGKAPKLALKELFERQLKSE